MPPIMTTSRLIGRRNAARLTRWRASDESRSADEGCSPVPPRRSGLRITPRAVLNVVFRIVFEEGQAHPAAQLQPESAGGVALIHGQTQTSMGVRDEDEVPDLRVAEGLDVADRYVATLAGFDSKQCAERETGFFRR